MTNLRNRSESYLLFHEKLLHILWHNMIVITNCAMVMGEVAPLSHERLLEAAASTLAQVS